jgi:hypothetical protein
MLPRSEETMLELETAFGLIAGVLVVSALAAGLVERAPLSFPMLFLGLGFLLGDRGLQVISIGLDSSVLEVVAVVALALVLFLDAVNLELTELRRDWLVPVLVLGPATLLVIGLLAGLGTLLLDFPVVLALLLGTILASTDPVVLRDVLRDRRIPRSVRRTLSVEAGTNDIVVLPALLVLIAIAPPTSAVWPGGWDSSASCWCSAQRRVSPWARPGPGSWAGSTSASRSAASTSRCTASAWSSGPLSPARLWAGTGSWPPSPPDSPSISQQWASRDSDGR